MSKFLDLIKESTPNFEKCREFGLDTATCERLEGLYNTDFMKKFIDAYHELTNDILKDEPFEVEDIIKFLAFKMDAFPVQVEDNETDERVAGLQTALAATHDDKQISNMKKNLRAGVKTALNQAMDAVNNKK